MAEVLGIGISHFPGFVYPDASMSMRVKQIITSPKVPERLKDPQNWPAPMQEEWGDDEGTKFAAKHRAQFLDGVRKARQAIDDFNPDLVVVFGDDQYENFREDIIPPYCIYIQDEFTTQPFLRGRGGSPSPNVWEEPYDKTFVTPGHRQAAKHLTTGLLEEDFDMPYSYNLLHFNGLSHAFMNTVLYLDYDRTGWDYPIVPVQVNAYGRNVIRNRGGSANLFSAEEREFDPPAPSPKRCFAMGAAVARVLKDSPWRAVVVGSSSWSHAFLTAKNGWVYPDVESDRKRFEELKSGDFTAWRDLDLKDVEENGEQEILNWVPMVGAMHELNQKASYCEFIESWSMNSCKCVAIFPPKS
jgi:Catalytic LigB subunit of aromatic ring-opening dioxygenase